jgi:hypothetical protein
MCFCRCLIEKESAGIVGEIDVGKNASSFRESIVCDDGSNVVEVTIFELGTKSPTSAGGLSSYKRFDISLLFCGPFVLELKFSFWFLIFVPFF